MSVGELDSEYINTKVELNEIKAYNKYTHNSGLEELRQVISDKLDADYNPADEIIVTAGVSEALDLAIRNIIEDGDNVIIVEPCYIAYRQLVELAGGNVISLNYKSEYTEESIKYTFPIEELRNTINNNSIKAILIASPNNPTGTMIIDCEIKKLIEILDRTDTVVI